jgi:hypothetical protein
MYIIVDLYTGESLSRYSRDVSKWQWGSGDYPEHDHGVYRTPTSYPTDTVHVFRTFDSASRAKEHLTRVFLKNGTPREEIEFHIAEVTKEVTVRYVCTEDIG